MLIPSRDWRERSRMRGWNVNGGGVGETKPFSRGFLLLLNIPFVLSATESFSSRQNLYEVCTGVPLDLAEFVERGSKVK